ncbi:MAG: ATP-binding protein [Acinetobacter sp.]
MPKDQRSIKCRQYHWMIYIGFITLSLLMTIKTSANNVLSQENLNCQAFISSIQAIKSDVDHIEALPKSGWVDIKKLPDYWDQRWENYHTSAWYKVNWQYQCPNQQTTTPITLVIQNINMAGMIYLNHEFLWKDQNLTEPLSRSWHTPRYWVLPASSLKQSENVLWIKVIGTATQKSGLGQLFLGEHTPMKKIYDRNLLEKRISPTLSFIINFIMGIFCLMVWLVNPTEKAFKWFGFVGIGWMIYVWGITRQDPIFGLSSINLDRICISIFCFSTISGCIAAWRLANRKFSYIESILFIFCGLAILCIFFLPQQYTHKALNFIFISCVIIFLLKCLTYPFIAYQSKLKETYVLAVQYLIFIPIVINDAIYIMTLKGHILSPYTSPIGTLLIGFILAFRLANNTKSIAHFNKTLEQRIIQAKNELLTSLNNQHQLALENAKLQERVNLSHDLHDGLGGSISRSMMLLENHDQIEKKQMLSILKLLRNDLRQTIDFGSCLDTKIPTGPIQWVAPLRHRFVQLFEEFEIHSKWILAENWKTHPNALQCLTMARIAEEALTNIIKHSHATQVEFSLTENEHFLILKISDNGIGFDPAQVDAGLHVGLHSMQQRVKRLGGLFEINSHPNQTILTVSLPFHLAT